jgi:hypothetical protein
MPGKDKCIEPKIGARIEEYIADVHAPSEQQKLTYEETIMLVLHLLRCPVCRQKLDNEARIHLETMCIILGVFIDDPILRQKRQEQVRKRFLQDDTAEDYDYRQPWYEVTPEEREKIKALWGKTDSSLD